MLTILFDGIAYGMLLFVLACELSVTLGLMNLKSCIVVSDGYHIYRVKRMLERMGMRAYGSPRPEGANPPAEGWRAQWVYTRQAIAYELWRIGIPI